MPDASTHLAEQARSPAEQARSPVEQARSLGQQSRAAEDQGDLATALALNEAAAAHFQEAGDAPGLLVAYRSRALILLRLGRVDEGCTQLARALGLALQMDAEFVWDTVGQLVGVAGYLAQAQVARLLALGAAVRSVLQHVQSVRGDFPLELRGPVEVATALVAPERAWTAAASAAASAASSHRPRAAKRCCGP